MRTYVIRRLLLFIPTLFIVSMLVFLSVRLLPGDFVDLLLSDPMYGATEVDRERFRERLGLNVPAHIAYVQWMRGILLEGTSVSLCSGTTSPWRSRSSTECPSPWSWGAPRCSSAC